MTAHETVHAYVRAFNAGDIEGLRRVFTPDALIHGALGWGRFDDVAPIWTLLHQALDMRLEVEQIVEASDDVVVRFVEHGHFVNEFRGQQPTGRTSEVVAIEWFQMSEGLIVRRWGVRDSASHFRQLGIVAG